MITVLNSERLEELIDTITEKIILASKTVPAADPQAPLLSSGYKACFRVPVIQ